MHSKKMLKILGLLKTKPIILLDSSKITSK